MTAPAQHSLVLSFDSVYKEHIDFVWNMAARFGIPPDARDDLVQDVFMVVHAKLHTLQSSESARSWMYSILRRVASKHRRRHDSNRFETHVDVEQLPQLEDANSPAKIAEQTALARSLWSSLVTLAPIRREVLIMVEIDQLTCPEIAELLELPINTVYSQLRYAREALKAAGARHLANYRWLMRES